MAEKWKSLEQRYRDQRARQLLENATWTVPLDEIIVNSNSSGQGYDADHENHEHHATILKHGYRYSHSTPVRHQDGVSDAKGNSLAHTVNHHTYKHVLNSDKNVSVHKVGNSYQWHTTTGGLGHPGVAGYGTTGLDSHLKNRKIKRKVTHNDLKETLNEDKAVRHVDQHIDVDGAVGSNEKIEEVSKEKLEPVDEISNTVKQNYIKKLSSTEKQSKAAGNFFWNSSFHPKEVDGKKAKHKSHMEFAKKEYQKGTFNSLKKEDAEPIEELAPPDPNKAKLDAQRQQIQKQRDAMRLNLQKQKAQKQMQIDKEKGQEQLSKIKEAEDDPETKIKSMGWSKNSIGKWTHPDHKYYGNSRAKNVIEDLPDLEKNKKKLTKEEELSEMMPQHVRTFGRASKLQKLHALQYQRLSAAGDLAGAERHRKRSIELKRVAYMAKDNPDKLPQ